LNLLALIFFFISYGLFVGLYNGAETGEYDFPTFDAPEIDFENIPASCSGFTDCIEYVGKVFINFVLGIVYVVLLIAEIVLVLVELLVLIANNSFEGFEGAPEWFNALILAMMAAALIIIIYKAIRKGDTDTA
jgi:hypothetical protein